LPEEFDHGVEAVSSADYRAPKASARGEYRVWRPVMPEDAPEEEAADAPPEEIPAPARSRSTAPARRRRVASRSGGAIHFVDEEPRPGDLDCDDDLAEYMHEDDVPTDS
jgi:hypothetical protein